LDYLHIARQLAPGVLPVLSVLVLLILVWITALHRRLAQFTHRLERLRRNRGVLEIERTLDEQAATVEQAERGVAQLRQEMGRCLQQVGIMRFNAFGEAGSDLSFSVALLDRNGDGLVVTGLWGREESRVFAKPVREGRSSYPLSKEEEEAIAAARRNGET
jgi:hypothetical protein